MVPTDSRPQGRRRSVALTLATPGVLGALFSVAAPAAMATTTPGIAATPFNEGGEWWSSDGCSWVPDSGYHTIKVNGAKVTGHYDFHHACVHHDGCYRNKWATRSTCDLWFRNDMYASCAALRSNSACYARADLYYRGVRVLGGLPKIRLDIVA